MTLGTGRWLTNVLVRIYPFSRAGRGGAVGDPQLIAVEQLYLALQQGVAQGQENPIVVTKAQKFDEIVTVGSLINHQGANLSLYGSIRASA